MSRRSCSFLRLVRALLFQLPQPGAQCHPRNPAQPCPAQTCPAHLCLQVWISADVMDRPGGVVYASGRALYVTPRQYAEDANGAAAANGAGEKKQ